MLLSSNVFSATPGHADEFTKHMADVAACMAETGIAVGVKVSQAGAASAEVFINALYQDMADYGASMTRLRATPRWAEVYMGLGNSAAVTSVDSFLAQVLNGYDDAPQLSEGTIFTSMWRAHPGRLSDLMAGMSIARDMHMKHGASAVRVMQIIGGRYTGCYGYNLSYPDMAAMGEALEAGRAEQEAFFEKAAENPSADLIAQIIMDSPIIIGA